MIRASGLSSPIALLLLSLCGGCQSSLGECEPGGDTAPIFYDDNGYPAYGGQALIETSCGSGTFCHSEGIDDVDRFGAPHGMDFDLRIALDEADTERLRRARINVWQLRAFVWEQVSHGAMPPGPPAGETARNAAAHYMANRGRADELPLPSIDGAEGREMLRNWLACGAQVVERVDPRPAGVEPVGYIVPQRRVCEGGLDACGDACVDTSSDPAHCGACGSVCDADQVCDLGSCLSGCAVGRSDCGGACVDLMSDAGNCGACGMICPGGAACTGGSCACAGGLRDCGGDCVDLSTNPSHCGACGAACSGGCAGGSCVTCGPTVSFSGDVQPLFTRSCASGMCHGGRRPTADMSLEAGRAWAELVGVSSSCGGPLVDPGSPSTSYLLSKLTGVGICSGNQMPKAGETLPASEIELITSWICRGALDD